MVNFLHNFLPQPILFQFGFIKIHWYGVFIVLGIVAGLFVVLKLAKRQGILSDQVYDLAFYMIIFGLFAARLYSVILDLPYYLKNPFEIIAVWHGGLAIHGAIIGGAITLLFYSLRKSENFWQRTKKPTKVGSPILFWQWADIIAPAAALGQAIGRWGNYFNQEVFGKPTNLPWGIPIDIANRPLEYLNSRYFQPTFLYESVLNLINFGILLFLFFWINSKKQAGKLASWQAGGLVSLIYLINYSIIRILMEFLRTDAVPEIFGVRLPIVASLVIIILSFSLIIFKLLNKQMAGRANFKH